eukprot:XP_001696135.1 predicted protein [Chlamydomonas reinhardtii]
MVAGYVQAASAPVRLAPAGEGSAASASSVPPSPGGDIAFGADDAAAAEAEAAAAVHRMSTDIFRNVLRASGGGGGDVSSPGKAQRSPRDTAFLSSAAATKAAATASPRQRDQAPTAAFAADTGAAADSINSKMPTRASATAIGASAAEGSPCKDEQSAPGVAAMALLAGLAAPPAAAAQPPAAIRTGGGLAAAGSLEMLAPGQSGEMSEGGGLPMPDLEKCESPVMAKAAAGSGKEAEPVPEPVAAVQAAVVPPVPTAAAEAVAEAGATASPRTVSKKAYGTVANIVRKMAAAGAKPPTLLAATTAVAAAAGVEHAVPEVQESQKEQADAAAQSPGAPMFIFGQEQPKTAKTPVIRPRPISAKPAATPAAGAAGEPTTPADAAGRKRKSELEDLPIAKMPVSSGKNAIAGGAGPNTPGASTEPGAPSPAPAAAKPAAQELVVAPAPATDAAAPREAIAEAGRKAQAAVEAAPSAAAEPVCAPQSLHNSANPEIVPTQDEGAVAAQHADGRASNKYFYGTANAWVAALNALGAIAWAKHVQDMPDVGELWQVREGQEEGAKAIARAGHEVIGLLSAARTKHASNTSFHYDHQMKIISNRLSVKPSPNRLQFGPPPPGLTPWQIAAQQAQEEPSDLSSIAPTSTFSPSASASASEPECTISGAESYTETVTMAVMEPSPEPDFGIGLCEREEPAAGAGAEDEEDEGEDGGAACLSVPGEVGAGSDQQLPKLLPPLSLRAASVSASGAGYSSTNGQNHIARALGGGSTGSATGSRRHLSQAGSRAGRAPTIPGGGIPGVTSRGGLGQASQQPPSSQGATPPLASQNSHSLAAAAARNTLPSAPAGASVAAATASAKGGGTVERAASGPQ